MDKIKENLRYLHAAPRYTIAELMFFIFEIVLILFWIIIECSRFIAVSFVLSRYFVELFGFFL
jgi:hypothetical protein